MTFEEMFKSYSFETKGDLEEYLRNCENSYASPMFYGFKYFLEIKEKKLIIPNTTYLYIMQSHIPDIGYIVNNDFMLQSRGQGEYNMSLMGAKKGIYDPKKVLNKKMWSIGGLNIWENVQEDSFS
jgi:hypothetical protein